MGVERERAAPRPGMLHVVQWLTPKPVAAVNDETMLTLDLTKQRIGAEGLNCLTVEHAHARTRKTGGASRSRVLRDCLLVRVLPHFSCTNASQPARPHNRTCCG